MASAVRALLCASRYRPKPAERELGREDVLLLLTTQQEKGEEDDRIKICSGISDFVWSRRLRGSECQEGNGGEVRHGHSGGDLR